MDESSLFGGSLATPDCSQYERCSAESIVGTMRRESSPFQGWEESGTP
jgi:hypothetical protein